MSIKKTDLIELKSTLDETIYPPAFTSEFNQLECLAHSHGTETFLVTARANGEQYVAKCYDKSVFNVVNEKAILAQLHHEGLPEYVGSFENESTCVTVRSFVEGTPLDVYARKSKLTEKHAADLCIQLCDILGYLHAQTPPVIHRDVKPQNIIVMPNGNIALIDFDIARQYCDDAETDTQFFGTRVYAPPEQYGFSQTDCRTDIYALGVLLRFLLTGDEKEKADKPVPTQYRRIVERCTAFAPKDRYASVIDVKKALLLSDGRHKKRLLRRALLLMTALVFLFAGFGVGRYTTLLAPAPAAQAVNFTEPLIEAAARVQLDKADGEALTLEELQKVTELYIFGTEVSKTQDAFSYGLSGDREYERGNIISLSDLALMPNIEQLQISYQTLEDTDGLAALKRPVNINLMHTRVSDISPLAGSQTLEQLSLFDTEVTDLTCLESCRRLARLEVGHTLISSIDSLGGFDTVTALSLKYLDLDTLDGIERFARLESLALNEANIKNIDALKGLPTLREVYVCGDMADMFESLLAGSNVSVIVE